MVREGLALLISARDEMEVVAQADDGVETAALARRLLPDVAILDASMPGFNGGAACKEVIASSASTRVLVLAMKSDAAAVRRLLQAGVSGYILKKSAGDALIDAIRAVAQGDTYVEPAIAGAMLQRAYSGSASSPRAGGADLSMREEEVLRAIAWGRSNKEIALELNLSIKTVESYKSAALHKLALSNRAEIVRFAIARGWLTEDNSPD